MREMSKATMRSLSGRVVVQVLMPAAEGWLITVDDEDRLHGAGVDELLTGMDRVGEWVDGEARTELLSLAARFR